MNNPIFTIGHSNRDLDTFIGLLQEADVQRLVDIRSIPRSRANPQFNQDTLPDALGQLGIEYRHMISLGGLRGKTAGIDPETNGYWQNDSFHRYADYALTPEFHQGLATLMAYAQEKRCAIMCSEAVWWRCHRRIVTDYLLARHVEVIHIMGGSRLDPATLTVGAKMMPEGDVVYPAG